MMKRGLLVGLVLVFGISVFAQEDPVLMRVNGKDILRSEFEYSYRHRTGNADAKTLSEGICGTFRSIEIEG